MVQVKKYPSYSTVFRASRVFFSGGGRRTCFATADLGASVDGSSSRRRHGEADAEIAEL